MKIILSNLSDLQLATVDLEGNISPWMEAQMYRAMNFSPDGEYIMITTIKRPFSYLVPYYRFPTTYAIYNKNAKLVKTIEEVPLTEDIPKGFMSVRKGKRSINWRNDKAATLVYAEALDEGDAEKEVERRDQVNTWAAPFEEEPKELVKTFNRYSGIMWANDKLALVYDYWWNTRNIKAYFINPSDPSKEPVMVQDRNYQDKYNDPGSPVTEENEYGREVMIVDNGNIYLLGDGYSKDGIYHLLTK
jgi:dipeptidyl aminopeptidase/acylaminoacyl peptidase